MIHWGRSGPKTGAPTAIPTIYLVQSQHASLTRAQELYLIINVMTKKVYIINLSIKTLKTLLKMFQNLI